MTVSDLRRGAVLLSCVTQASYTYDTSGNRKSETDLDGKITSYAYDGLGRLTQESETNGRTISYAYDAAGNRTQMMVSGTEVFATAYTYDANNRLLTETKTQNSEITATSYTYDANGNTLSKSVQQGGDPAEITAFTYDRFNQLVSVTADGIPVYYSYNAEGIRTAKLSCGILTSFLLDGGDVAAEVQNDVLQANYLRGINLICREQGGEKEYYLFDAHADVIALTDEDGEETRTYDYDAFGCETQPDPLDANPFRYCGEYFDIETGSYYLRARYYAPAIGRFTQQDIHWTTANMIYGDNPQKINEREDALGLKNYTYVPQITAVMQAGNQYVYGINDPITFVDQNGNIITPANVIGGLIGAGIGALIGVAIANYFNLTGWSRGVAITGGAALIGIAGWFAGPLIYKAIEPAVVAAIQSGSLVINASNRWIVDTIRTKTESAWNTLTYAANYGIKSYYELRKMVSGSGLQVHHIIEQRFKLNIDLSIVVTTQEHQVFTNAWRSLIPYGTDYDALGLTNIWKAAQEVYKDYPEILEAIKKALF